MRSVSFIVFQKDGIIAFRIQDKDRLKSYYSITTKNITP